jgi:N6-adenosine-specific RNA methylase IME4
MKRENSRKPEEFISLIRECSNAPFIELFARGQRENWFLWGNQANEENAPDWPTYKNCTKSG